MREWVRDEIAKYQKQRAKRKPFGIEVYLEWPQPGWFRWKWYATEKRRDQALQDLNKSICTLAKECTKYRKVNR